MKIRFATEKDNSALLRIYSQYIDTPITFEYTLPTQEEFARRIKNITDNYPYIVCEKEDKIVGYAYAYRQMKREAYQWNAELSIYIDRDFTSAGLGKKMYRILMEILKLQRIKTVYGGVTLPNEKSEKFHSSLGFEQIGTYHKTGYKCKKWYNVTWFGRQIASYDKDPKPILSINEIEEEKIKSIFEKFI